MCLGELTRGAPFPSVTGPSSRRSAATKARAVHQHSSLSVRGKSLLVRIHAAVGRSDISRLARVSGVQGARSRRRVVAAAPDPDRPGHRAQPRLHYDHQLLSLSPRCTTLTLIAVHSQTVSPPAEEVVKPAAVEEVAAPVEVRPLSSLLQFATYACTQETAAPAEETAAPVVEEVRTQFDRRPCPRGTRADSCVHVPHRLPLSRSPSLREPSAPRPRRPRPRAPASLRSEHPPRVGTSRARIC